ncbi:MAG: azurin [Verrucomicrobiota bacterium]|jgi:azurin
MDSVMSRSFDCGDRIFCFILSPMKLFLSITALALLVPLHAAPPPLRVEVTVNDQIRYSTKRIEGKTGVPMEIALKHTGKIPKASMSHNLVILKPGSMVASISAKCGQAKESNYIATDAETKAAILAYAPQLGPGESHVIKFTPKEPGDYPFLCTFPGHFGEMNGIITVK